MRGFIVMGIFALYVASRCSFAQEVTKHLIDDEDIISAESINAAEEPDLSTSPATVQYRVRPFNNFQQQYQAQQQARLQQQQIHQVHEDEQAEASQEEAEEESLPHQHIQQQMQQQQQPQQPLFRRQYQPQQQQQQQQQQDHPVFRKVEQNQKRFRIRDEVRQQQKQELEDELEQEEEPDRLTLLLEKSDFQCQGRSAGYFADEGLGCEVFHYCNDNQKHSWICPEGFSFHQVHLICMPAGADNVCQQSSKYHFVNDYLYKALNMEEHQQKPNVMLRYSERYYPEEIFQDERQEYDEEDYQPRNAPSSQFRQAAPQQQRQQPINAGLRRQPITAASVRTQAQQQQQQQQQQPQQQVQPQPQPVINSVFRSPEEINIPLQQRRPNYSYQPTTVQYDSGEEQQEEGEY